jgi:hypothetical protein
MIFSGIRDALSGVSHPIRVLTQQLSDNTAPGEQSWNDTIFHETCSSSVTVYWTLHVHCAR